MSYLPFFGGFLGADFLDVLYNLIYEMGRACGYKNLELTDIRDVYAPEVLKEHYPTRYKTEIVALPPES